MSRFSKKLALLCALGGLSLSLTGCHGSKGLPEFTVPEEFDTSRNYEITFWAKNDTNKTQTEIYKKAIADFEALYPNITVNLNLYTDYGKIYNDVITNISTNTTPNVCITYPDHIATYLTGQNTVVPLDDLFADEKYGLGGTELAYDGPAREEVIPQFLNECSIDGHYYAVPYMRSTEACYVNKTYVENLGYTLPDVLTWDFIWEVSEAATAQNADGTYVVNGQNVLIPFIYKSTDNMMIQMLKQKNAGYSTADGSSELFNDTTTDLLYGIAGHVKSGAFSTFKISGYPANFLNAGQCIFAIDSTAGATWMGTDAPLSDISEDSLVQFETAVRMIPQFDPEHPKMISQGPSVCVFNKSAFSWNGNIHLFSPALTDNGTHYAVKIEASKLLLDHVDNTFVTPVFNGSASLRDASGQLIENVVKSTRRKETVDDAYMQKLYSDVESLYRLGQGSDASFGKKELGAMPRTSVILLSTLAVTWILILLYVGREYLKNRKK